MLTDYRASVAHTLDITSGTIDSDAYALGSNIDFAKGMPMTMRVHVDQTFSGGTSVEFQVITSTDSALSSDVEVIGRTAAIAAARLVEGQTISVPLAPYYGTRNAAGTFVGQVRGAYVALRAVVSGTFTAGSVSAHLIPTSTDDGPRFDQKPASTST